MPDKSSDPGLNRACTVRLRSWVCKTCNVGQITGIWSPSEKSARGPNRLRAFSVLFFPDQRNFAADFAVEWRLNSRRDHCPFFEA
jgi:hypothetical protein